MLTSRKIYWQSDLSLTHQTFYPLNSELAELWVGGDPGSGGDGGHDQPQHGDLPGRGVLSQLELSPDEQGGHSGDDGEEEDGQEPSGETERSINTILGTKNVIKTWTFCS